MINLHPQVRPTTTNRYPEVGESVFVLFGPTLTNRGAAVRGLMTNPTGDRSECEKQFLQIGNRIDWPLNIQFRAH